MEVDTTGLFPEGDYILELSDVPAPSDRGGFVFWNFEFMTELDGSPAEYRESIPIWLSAPMFRALGFKETRPGRFDVEPDNALGRKIKGKVVHETLTTGKRAGSAVARLRDMAPYAGDPVQAAVEAQAQAVPRPSSAPSVLHGAEDDSIPF